MATTTYAIALGGNVRGRHGCPAATLCAALLALGGVVAASPIVVSAPLGPSRRAFANAAALIETEETPTELLARLKTIERAFGRRRGRRWGARVLDLDIILWSGGCWTDRRVGRSLTVPHAAFRDRAFVLKPLMAIAPGWRDPIDGRTVRQLAHVVDRAARRS